MIVDLIYGDVPEHWQMISVGQLLSDNQADLQTGPFGTMLHASSYVPEGTPVVAVQHIGENRIVHNDLPMVNNTDFVRLERYQLRQGDILFGRKGAVDRRALVTDSEAGWLQGSDCIRLRLLSDDVYPSFISYVFGTPNHKDWINRNAHGATMPSLNQEILSRVPIPLPPLPEQKAIARILGALDDKIELNRKMNRTLEEMARAIFKSWFVDFDPVRQKAEGRRVKDEGGRGETLLSDFSLDPSSFLDLFPDTFEDSELGEIPAGWKVATLGSQIDIKHGYAFKGEYFSSEPVGDILLTPGNFSAGGGFKTDKFKYYLGPVPDDFILHEGDLLVTMTDLSKQGDTLGYAAFIPKPDAFRFLHNQRLGKITLKDNATIGKIFTYNIMKLDDYRQEVLATATGSTVRHSSPSRIQAYRFPSPSHEIASAFETLTMPFFKKMAINSRELSTLAALRDTLLPKLMSGEVRVKDEG